MEREPETKRGRRSDSPFFQSIIAEMIGSGIAEMPDIRKQNRSAWKTSILRSSIWSVFSLQTQI
jgi:hypothetical protein